MTNKEALTAVLEGLTFSDLALNKALLDRQVVGTEDYSAADSKNIDLCAIDLLYALYTRPDISEGDVSISHPDFLRKIEARLLSLARKHGVSAVINQFEKPKPTIRNGTNRW